MPVKSAGIILYRFKNDLPEVFLVHPGGPYWIKKDENAWSIPKGIFEENEDPLDAAKREMKEETGIEVSGTFIELNPVKQKSGKTIFAWALEKDIDETKISSNHFEIEWPPRSGQYKSFPEIDRAAWFTLDEAKKKIIKGQLPLLEQLEKVV